MNIYPSTLRMQEAQMDTASSISSGEMTRGGIEIQDVAQGAEQQSPFKGFPVNPVPQPLLGRKAFFGFPVLHQFNGVHQSQAAYFPTWG